MDPIGMPYKLTILTETPPLIQQAGNQVVLNFPLTIPEAMFLAFVGPSIDGSLKKKCQFTYLGASNGMQNEFNQWIAKNFTAIKSSSDDLDLVKVISSIWNKAKVFVDNRLEKYESPEAIQNEKKQQEMANWLEQDLRAQGGTGKLFTTRQAQLLLASMEEMAKSQKNGSLYRSTSKAE